MYCMVYTYTYDDMNVYIVSEWYQPGALLFSEEGIIIAGLLVGLNTIDYNVVMKGEEFDKPVSDCVLCLYT